MNKNLAIKPTVVPFFMRPVFINGKKYTITVIKDNSCSEFNYYIRDDIGSFCTRISDESFENWDIIDGLSFDSIQEFVEYFGDGVKTVIPNVGNAYISAIKKHGRDFVNLLCGEIVVMQE